MDRKITAEGRVGGLPGPNPAGGKVRATPGAAPKAACKPCKCCAGGASGKNGSSAKLNAAQKVPESHVKVRVAPVDEATTSDKGKAKGAEGRRALGAKLLGICGIFESLPFWSDEAKAEGPPSEPDKCRECLGTGIVSCEFGHKPNQTSIE